MFSGEVCAMTVSEELRLLFGDQPVEGLFVAGFDHAGKLCGVAANARHRALSWVKVWELASLAAEMEARSVAVIVYPSGPAPAPTPSAHELAVFDDLMARTRRAGIELLDCLVYRGDRLWSLRETQEGRATA
jgi:hypothetical protein